MRPNRKYLVPGFIVFAGLAVVAAMALGGASNSAITWSGLVLGIMAGVAIAIASREDDGQ